MSKWLYVSMTTPGDPYVGTRSTQRIVKVRLTEDQCNVLRPKVTGRNGTDTYFEAVEPLSIQDEEGSDE